MKLILRQILKIASIIAALCFILIFILNTIISCRSNKYLYDTIEDLPDNEVALVLGTSRFKRDGSANPYFYNRIDAAVKLYENNKVNYILVSGDNRSIYYNEPGFMRDELLKRGIPDNIIYMDFEGFRTYESVIRSHKVFGQESYTIVSQKFHNQRAVFIARSNNINAVAFNAKDVAIRDGFRIRLREVFARIKVFVDLVFNKQHGLYGDPVEIGH